MQKAIHSINKHFIKRINKIKKITINSYLLFVVLLLLFLYFFHPIPLQGANVDMGYHLLLGERILQLYEFPSQNFVSYTALNFPYININWLSQVIFYSVYKLLGFNGLISIAITLIIGTFILLFKNVELKGKIYSIFIVSLIYLQILIDRAQVKPELFSLFLLSFYLFILYKYRKSHTKLIYLLPFLQIFWVNLHIFFIVGNSVVCLFFLNELIQNKFKVKNKKIITLGIVSALCMIANIFNPHFLNGAFYPFTVFSNYGYKVIENYNFFLAFSEHKDITFLYFIVAVFLLWISIFVSKSKTKLIDIFLSLFFTFFAFYAIRNVSLFVIGTLIPCITGVHYVIKKIEKKYSETTVFNTKILLAITTALFILPGFFWAFSIHGLGIGVIDEAEEAVTLLKESKTQGPIYNNYNIGNYLVYKLYPKEKVFVNGTPEAYPNEFFENTYYPIEASYQTFENESKKYKFNIVFYDHVNQATDINPLLSNIIKSEDWKLVFLNNRIVIFLKNNEENKEIIKKHLITQDTLNLTQKDVDSKVKLQNLSNLFRIFEWYEEMYEIDLKYLKHEPKNCIALRHVAVYMNNTNHPLSGIYQEKLQKNCQWNTDKMF